MAEKRKNSKILQQEPVLVIKPASRMLGLDYLHVSLVVLVIILIGLVLAISTFSKPATYVNCQAVLANGTCVTAQHNSTQALEAAERIVASYSLINSSLALLPYYSLPNQSTVSYVANQSEWLVMMPYRNPYATNSVQYLSLLIRDSNLTLDQPFLQTTKPIITTQNRVLAFGTVGIAGKASCTTNASAPLSVYGFFDIYAPGALQGISTSINESAKFGSSINTTYKVLFTGFAADKYAAYGINTTQTDGAYMFCASEQPSKFAAYLKNFSILFQGNPLDPATLQQVAIGSGLNITEFGSCMQRAPRALQNQALLASYYSVNVTPAFVVNCKYQTIPQTLGAAIGYALNNTK